MLSYTARCLSACEIKNWHPRRPKSQTIIIIIVISNPTINFNA